MRLPRLGQSQAEQDRAYIAGLARGAEGDLAIALEIGLSGLDPERRVAILRHVVEGMPPVMRTAIWGKAGLGNDGWQQLRDTIVAEERRPLLVNALVERGRQARELDLAAIPASCYLPLSAQ